MDDNWEGTLGFAPFSSGEVKKDQGSPHHTHNKDIESSGEVAGGLGPPVLQHFVLLNMYVNHRSTTDILNFDVVSTLNYFFVNQS